MKFNVWSFYSCDYNKYTLSVVKRLSNLQIKEFKEEIKTEYDDENDMAMEVDENNIISVQ